MTERLIGNRFWPDPKPVLCCGFKVSCRLVSGESSHEEENNVFSLDRIKK